MALAAPTAAFVIDVSACMPWCCEDEATPVSEALLRRAATGARLHVPSLFPWEMMNALAAATRRRRISVEQASAFLDFLAEFSIEIAAPPKITDLPRLHTLAARNQLTAYDAAYLDLAKLLAIPLATLDGDLIKAARAEGLTVL